MKSRFLIAVILLALLLPVAAYSHTSRGGIVDVRVLSDGKGELAQYRTYPRGCGDGRYFYMEATRGDRYSINVANRSDSQIGVVIAVDGRNIISGMKSDLKPHERMYIIAPHATHTFEGWRTGMDRTNRFYFTEQSDSYAERVFSDASAMGTIAVAVYRERFRERVYHSPEPTGMKKDQAGSAVPSPAVPAPAARAPMESRAADRLEEKVKEQAGTGFGETTYSPSRIVSFEPERVVADRIVLKYEWRSELCKKGIISCEPKNRLWPGGGFAPVPHDFKG